MACSDTNAICTTGPWTIAEPATIYWYQPFFHGQNVNLLITLYSMGADTPNPGNAVPFIANPCNPEKGFPVEVWQVPPALVAENPKTVSMTLTIQPNSTAARTAATQNDLFYISVRDGQQCLIQNPIDPLIRVLGE
jgi:hypothetical protein